MLWHVVVCHLLLGAYVICIISSIDGYISIFLVEIFTEGITMLSYTRTHTYMYVCGDITLGAQL